MKNAVGIIPQLHDCYDFAINEQCQHYNECDNVADFFSRRGKAALQVEYTDGDPPGQWCAGAEKFNLKTKFCAGSNDDGLCKQGNWTNCFHAQPQLPPTTKLSRRTYCADDYLRRAAGEAAAHATAS